jgi:hypothetical protein
MDSKMLNLLKHHRIHVPNGLAVLAAVLLLASSTIGYKANQDLQAPDQPTVTTAKVNTSEGELSGAVAQKKSRSLNLGLLLFRR